jgi:subtilisin family serine protease
MKNLKKYCIAFILLTGFGQIGFSQLVSENIWVTFNNVSDVPVAVDGRLQSSNAEVQKLINEFNISSVEQAVPSSMQEALQKVYNVACFCDADALSARIKNSTSSLYKPEIAPKYELMNDPDDYDITVAQDYALDLIDAKGAWEYTTGSADIILGISDGNFYTDHEDLETEYININTVAAPTYYYYHGTAVATIAGGATNNSQGKSSIGYDCKLSLTSMNYDRVLELSYAGVPVINLSWASGCYNSSYVQAIVDEVYDNGTILVASAGNGGTCGGSTNLVYPAAHDHVIAVSSIGPQDNHERTIGDPTTTHQHNSSVDICAPGYDVALTVAPGWYLTGNGTSFAAPYVTGTIGLMLSVNPCLTFEDVEEILSNTAVNIDAQNPNYIGQLGAGRLNAKEAVKMAAELPCGTAGDGNGGDDPTGTDPVTPGTTVNSYDESKDESNGAEINQTANVSDNLESDLVNVNLFPNPTTSASKITWNADKQMTLKVFNMNGSLVHQEELRPETREATINVEDKGVYFILIENNGQVEWSGKLVKM